VFLLLSGSLACQKAANIVDDVAHPNTPSSSVPDEIANKVWFTGTLSAISFFDRDGHHLGNDHEAGREFQFYEDEKGNGRIKFWQYLGMRNFSSCVTEIYTYKEGTVVFEGQTFTFYPIAGHFRTVKDKCATGNGTTTRPTTAEDLVPTTYRWALQDLDGSPHLYTYDKEDVNHENPLFVYAIGE